MPENREFLQDVRENRRILVVDDEMINREILGEYLRADYDVLFACDGSEAMEMVRSNKDTLSLVLLDLLMPVMSGREVLIQMKEDPELARIPVIVITADQESEVECLNLGAVDFIPKPYPQAEVVLARVLRTIELFEDRDTIQSTERDTLTGLYNKEFFYRYSNQFDLHHKTWAMDAILVDVNHFHMINERYGKAYGDKVLRGIGSSLQKIFDELGGIVCREGADTFMIYVPHRNNYEEHLDRVSADISEDDAINSHIHLRMGVYSNVDKTIEMESRFDRAKTAADSVKGSFHQTIGFYDETFYEKEIFAEQLIEDFQAALDEKQFMVYYQPKFDIRTPQPILTSAEGLARWNHPRLGLVSPGVFIPLFEENGLIRKLDIYIWTEAARQIREWKDRLGFAVPVSVNVSRVDLYDPNILTILSGIVEQYGLSPEDLLLEITESAYTHDSAQIIDMVMKMRDLGFRIEMDDFGTGYSSLNMISKLPIDAMKMDMQFVRNAFKKEGDTRVMEVIIEISDYLSIPVVAEGVETYDQLRALKAMGCDIAQGYYFSKPVPADEFESFIIEGQKAKLAAEAEAIREKEAAEAKKFDEINRMRNEDQNLRTHASDIHPENDDSGGKGFNLRKVNYLFAIAACIAAVLLFTAHMMVRNGYHRMDQASSRYIAAQQAVSDMEISSDYLTDRVRSFVYTGDVQYMNDFFEEVDVTRRREKALSVLEEILDGSDNSAYESLSAALELSNELIQQEHLAMVLRLESDIEKTSEIPPVLFEIELSEADKDLTPEEKREKAKSLVFDDFYLGHKQQIRENVKRCTESLIQSSSKEMEQASSRMDRLLSMQAGLAVFFLMIVLGLVFFIREQVRRPLTLMVEQIRSEKPVSQTGAEEIRFVARTYNEVLAENRKQQAQLSYDASHDALTGLFNRGAYDVLLKSIDMEHVALLMVDVDDFKLINTRFGHDVGDKVLKRVADTLRNTFRSTDIICRVGGDEFVVIMTRVNSSMRQIAQNKIEQANQMLLNPKDDTPPVSLSVGVAFSDRENPQGDIFKDADIAMYAAKNAGKGNCSIY